MHDIVAVPALLAVATLGLWTGGNAARHIDVSSIVLDAGKTEEVLVAAKIPAFVVTIRTEGGPVRHVAADMDADMRTPVDPVSGKDRLAEAVMFATAKVLRDPDMAEADGQAVAKSIAAAANERMDGAVAGIHVRKLSVFDQSN